MNLKRIFFFFFVFFFFSCNFSWIIFWWWLVAVRNDYTYFDFPSFFLSSFELNLIDSVISFYFFVLKRIVFFFYIYIYRDCFFQSTNFRLIDRSFLSFRSIFIVILSFCFTFRFCILIFLLLFLLIISPLRIRYIHYT